MPFMKRRYVSVALAATVLAGITFSADLASAAEKTIALVQINQQALFFNQMNAGAEKAAKEAGVKLVIFNANNDPAAQNSAIETYIQQKVDGIAVVAIDVNGIMPAVKQAAAANIPVVAIDAILPDGPQKAQIGVDNAKAGADMGKFFLDYVKSDMSGKAKIGVVGALNSFIQNIRQKGFEDALKDQAGITKAGVVDGQNVQDTALRHGRAGTSWRCRRSRKPGQAEGHQGLWLGSDQAGDCRYRCGLCRRCYPAGSRRHGCRRRQGPQDRLRRRNR
jgi:ribose transport system substrate-binding protein